MTKANLNEEQIKKRIKDYCDNYMQCGLEVFIVKKDSPKLKRISLSEEKNDDGKDFRNILEEMFFKVLKEKFLSNEVEYADGHQVADNQNKILFFEQKDKFYPFLYLSDTNEISEFALDDLVDAIGLMVCIRRDTDKLWLYQHLWSVMVPNKKKTNTMARLMNFENKIVFAEQREDLLTIAKKIDILIMDDYVITDNITLLQQHFRFQDYIYQSAQQAVQAIAKKNIIENTEKLTEYINRGKPKYAKKMMRIGSSSVFDLTQEQLMHKISKLSRWQGKFNINHDLNQIVLRTYVDVENLIDLFDERYTRSEVTDTEYDTDVKKVAKPIKEL